MHSNTHYKQYIENSSNITNEGLKSFIGKYALIECTVPSMKNDSFEYIESVYGRISITIYDTRDKTNLLCCINSYYRFDQQMLNTFGEIESICIEEKIIKRDRCFLFNYLLGEQVFINYDIKIKLENMHEYVLRTDEAFRKFDGSKLHVMHEATPSNYYILNV